LASGLGDERNSSRLSLLRVERWFFTSDFLMRLIAAPVDPLTAWKVLVWSGTWKAEGEKYDLDYYYLRVLR
jgi:hypothetical protein